MTNSNLTPAQARMIAERAVVELGLNGELYDVRVLSNPMASQEYIELHMITGAENSPVRAYVLFTDGTPTLGGKRANAWIQPNGEYYGFYFSVDQVGYSDKEVFMYDMTLFYGMQNYCMIRLEAEDGSVLPDGSTAMHAFSVKHVVKEIHYKSEGRDHVGARDRQWRNNRETLTEIYG
jgi:hypothetical protein